MANNNNENEKTTGHKISSMFQKTVPMFQKLLSAFKNVFQRKTRVKEAEEEVVKKEIKKESKSAIAMVPIFSMKTLLVIIIGLIVGLLVSLGYWVISPSLSSPSDNTSGTTGSESLGLFGFLGMQTNGPFQSQVTIQVVNPGSSYMDLRDLQSKAEYYAAKAKSLPFYEFLSQELDKINPQRPYTVDELDGIINSTYDWDAQLPAIRVTATGETETEAGFLAGLIPDAFKEYLIVEENSERQKKYQNTLAEIDDVKAALLQAEQELDALSPDDILNDPQYVALDAKVTALEEEVKKQAAIIASLETYGSNTAEEFTKTQEQIDIITQKITEAERQQKVLEEIQINDDVANDAAYVELNAKITALQAQLNTFMTGWTDADATKHLGLAEMIATGVNSGAEYTQRAKDVDRTSEALADAKKELALLESRSSANTTMTIDQKFLQTKLDSLNSQLETLKEKQDTLAAQAEGNDAETTYMVTAAALSDAKSELGDLEVKLGYDSVLQNTEYKVAQDKVDQLNLTIGDLTKQLGSLVGETTDSSEITGYLVAGKPLKPTPVVPERPKASKILMTGAIVGVLLGWIILNIKWIAKGMPSNKPRDEEDIAPPTETSGQAS
jgi:hypothetical protein